MSDRRRFTVVSPFPDGPAIVRREATSSLLEAKETASQRSAVVVYIPEHHPIPEPGDRVRLAPPQAGLRRSLA